MLWRPRWPCTFGKRTTADELPDSLAVFVGGSRCTTRPQFQTDCGGDTIKGSDRHASFT